MSEVLQGDGLWSVKNLGVLAVAVSFAALVAWSATIDYDIDDDDDEVRDTGEKDFIWDQSQICHSQCISAGYTEDSQDYWACVDRCLGGN